MKIKVLAAKRDDIALGEPFFAAGHHHSREDFTEIEFGEGFNVQTCGQDSVLLSTTGGEGSQGPAGPQGEQGPPGADSTVPGPQGSQGLPGQDSTVPGPQGPAGDDGYTPIKGVDYFDGEDGSQGPPGDDGSQGPQGNPGPNQISTSTDSSITGILKGSAGKVSQATAPDDFIINSDSRLSDARTPLTHNQPKSTISDFAHSHPESEVTNLVTDLSGKEPANSNIQTHVISAHAPSNAQKNSDITKSEIEAKLTGEISSHTHAGGGGGGVLRVVFAAPILAALAWTNMPAALSFLFKSATAGDTITKADLTNFTQCRLLVNKQATAGASASKLILRYRTAFNQVVANYSDIGVSEVSVAVNVQNSFLDTGWINLVAGAKADVFIAVLGSGGDGTLDPVFGSIVAEFK